MQQILDRHRPDHVRADRAERERVAAVVARRGGGVVDDQIGLVPVGARDPELHVLEEAGVDSEFAVELAADDAVFEIVALNADVVRAKVVVRGLVERAVTGQRHHEIGQAAGVRREHAGRVGHARDHETTLAAAVARGF